MIVVSTAISGSKEKEYLEKFRKYATDKGKKIHIFNVGEMILERVKLRRPRANLNNILNMRPDTMQGFYDSVFERILKEIPKLLEEKYSIIINIHGLFYWKYRYKKSIDYSYISQINPDLFVNFLNNSDVVLQNMRKEPKWNFLFRNHTEDYVLEKIMDWQTAEVCVVDAVASSGNKNITIIPAGGNTSILYRFMFEPWRKVFYLSMPLTFLNGEENTEARQQIEKFAEWLEKYVLLIDPRHVEPLKINQLSSNAKNKAVQNNIVGRDLELLIPQCDGVIGFYPKEVTSYGENSEREEMHWLAGDTFLIYPKKDSLSPFFTEWIWVTECNESFLTKEEFQPWFLKNYLGKE